MPIYSYRSTEGKLHEKIFPIGTAPKTIVVSGVTAVRSFQDDMSCVSGKAGWPLECIASGVNAEQGRELSKHLADSGIPTHVTADGNPVYTSSAHRRRALNARGLFDKNSFY